MDKSHALPAVTNCNYENHSYTPPMQNKSAGRQETLNVCPSTIQETSPKHVPNCTVLKKKTLKSEILVKRQKKGRITNLATG
jgi:hypothetical protein